MSDEFFACFEIDGVDLATADEREETSSGDFCVAPVLYALLGLVLRFRPRPT